MKMHEDVRKASERREKGERVEWLSAAVCLHSGVCVSTAVCLHSGAHRRTVRDVQTEKRSDEMASEPYCTCVKKTKKTARVYTPCARCVHTVYTVAMNDVILFLQ